MSWLEKGISSLKGQITNFTKEVLSEEDSNTLGDQQPGQTPTATAAATRDPLAATREVGHHGGDEEEESFFGHASHAASVALSGLPALPSLPLFGRQPEQHDLQVQQHCSQLEATVQRLLQQLEELSETRDKEALELATVKRELRLRGQGDSGSGSGHSDSPQLPDDSGLQHGADGTGISPALSDDGFTKLDPSETELWEATQELSQSLDAQVELHKRELEKYHQMKQEWTVEKTNLENTVQQLQKQLNALQDWQSPDPDFANGNEVELNNTVSKLQQEIEVLQNEKVEATKKMKLLESKAVESEEEKSELLTQMEELDIQNQEALGKILDMKNGIQSKYDALKSEHETLLSNAVKKEEEQKQLQSVEKEKDEIAGTLISLESQNKSLKSEYESLKEKYEVLQQQLCEVQSSHLLSSENEKEDLQLQLSTLKSENFDLLTKVDSIQLDFESLEVKYSTVISENETLKTKLCAVQCDLDAVKSEMAERLRGDEHNTSEQSSSDLTSSERYVIDKLTKIISIDIPEDYCKDIAERNEASEKELEDQLDKVAALVKMTVDLRWKRDTLERNLIDYPRQLRDLSAQLSGRDKQVAKLEEECVMLRENMESLLDGLNVTPEKGMLPSIPETPEAGDDEILESAFALEQGNKPESYPRGKDDEDKDLSRTIGKLETEIGILREARSNLENETVRLRNELQELTKRLRSSEAMLRNQDNLEREVGRWREQCERLRNAHSDLQKENSSLREEAELARFGQDSLQAEVSEWKTIADSATQERQDALLAKESLVAEVAELKANMTASSFIHNQLEETLQSKAFLESEVEQLKESLNAMNESNRSLDDANVAMEDLRNEIAVLKQELQNKNEVLSDGRITELLQRTKNLESDKRNLELALTEMGSENASLCEHIMSLQQKCDSLSADLACKASSEYDNTQNFLHEKQALEEQVSRMTINYENVKKECEDLNALKSSLQTELDELKQRLQQASDEAVRYERSLQEKIDNELSLNEQLQAMSAAKHASEQEVSHLQENIQQLQELLSHTHQENQSDSSSVTETLERKLHSMLEEKEQMLSVLTEKTRENSVLRSENQKLLAAMSSHTEIHAAPSTSEEAENSTYQLNQLKLEKDQLISTVQIKHNESLKYHTEILRLRALLDQRQQQRELPSVDVNIQDVKDLPAGDSISKSQEMIALEAKCASLANSLQKECTQNTYLQNEMQEQHEKEGMLTRELERLREHLVEVEETYTNETLRLEEQVQDLQAQLNSAEERLRSVSTAHTSASILANQHVESLQGQSRLIGQQRDELQSRLSAAEDREQKHAAALRNLQAVLEQFQRDKEREVASMTEKIRLELQAAHRKHNDFLEEIRILKGQLTEAKEGLSAASRLGEQLDKKSDAINSLKEQILQLQKALKGAEDRVKAASQSVEGKVDKSLLKNLVVGLLTAPANTRSPALRVVASVLDFNHDERTRVGLEQGSSHTEQSLSEAFVRFLESESRPQMHLRLLPEASSKAQTDAKKESSGSTAGESPVRRSPLLSEVVLPTLAPLPVGRSSSSILKDVLKNDL